MADFPDDVFTQRTITNRVGQVYDESKQTTIYAEDLQKLGDEITAIEEFLEDDVIDGWQNWTPQVDQGANTNISKTIVYARYKIIGDTFHAQCFLSMTGAGVANNKISISLPFTLAEATQFCGFFGFYSNVNGKTYIGGAVSPNNNTKICGSRDNSNGGEYMGADPNVALGSSSVLTFNITGKTA